MENMNVTLAAAADAFTAEAENAAKTLNITAKTTFGEVLGMLGLTPGQKKPGKTPTPKALRISEEPVAKMYDCVIYRNGFAYYNNGSNHSVLWLPYCISFTYGGARNAHRIAVLEEGMQYKPISLPPEDSQFLSTREFDVEEICRMFQVPPHLVQDLKRSTFNNIEHQGIAFVQYSLMPWIIRIEKGIMKDLLLEEEQDVYFPKFNVDGLMRGDYQSRMNAYAIGVGNGFFSPNDVRRLENMDLIPDDQGGNDYYLNGSYNKLQDAGAAYNLNQPQEDAQPDTEEQDEPDENPDEETDDRFLRKKRRKKYKNGGM